MNKTNEPKLRFPQYTDEWEQRKLKDFGKATGGTSIESEFSDDGKYKVISIGSYSEDSVYRDQGIRAIESEKTKNRVLNEGDLTMILNDKTASGNIIGRVLLIEKSGVYVYNQRTERIEIDHEKFDSLFIYEMLNAPNVRDKIIKQSQGNTQIYVNWPTIAETDYLVPKIEEQRYLGKFFYNLDNLITLHQRKVEDLKKNKKGLLQKMFPKEGERVPEIRLPGFTDDWEQRKLSELATMHARIGWQNLRTSEFLDDGDYMLITGTDFEDGRINFSTCHYVEKERYDQDKHIQIRNGSILITKDGTLGKVAYVQGLQKPATLNAGVFNVEIKDENEVDRRYLFQYLKAPFLMDYVGQKATGGTIKHLNQNILVDFPVEMPKKAEQEKIGAYFNRIDNLITLHQRKLDSIKKYKKGLLQQMFI